MLADELKKLHINVNEFEHFTGIDATTQASSAWDKLDEFTDHHFTLSYEYNSACHCHPEYTTYEQTFPSSLLAFEEDDELDKTIGVEIQKKITLYFEKKAQRTQAEAAETAKRKQQDEEREHKLYLELKQKFGEVAKP